MRGWIAKTASRGHAAISRSVISATADSYARIRSPWNGGSISRRRMMCGSPLRTSTESGPTTGASVIWRDGGGSWARSV